jgi:hypothetical protein
MDIFSTQLGIRLSCLNSSEFRAWKGFNPQPSSVATAVNTGRSIIFSVITGIYNKKGKGPTLTLSRRNADHIINSSSPYRAVHTFHLGYKNQSFYAVSDTSRCLFSDKYKNADRFI